MTHIKYFIITELVSALGFLEIHDFEQAKESIKDVIKEVKKCKEIKYDKDEVPR